MRKCPAIESSKFLCDREAEYQIEGTVWCNIHARREQGPLPKIFADIDPNYEAARDAARDAAPARKDVPW